MTPREQILETMRRVLRQTTLRAILKPLDRTPLDVSPSEAAELLAPYEDAIDRDFLMCTEVANQLVALSHSGADAVQVREEAETLTLNSDDEDPAT